MNIESLTASLHAGLIQRARPPKVVPLREDLPLGRQAVQLRGNDILRARPVPVPGGESGRAAPAFVRAEPAPAAAAPMQAGRAALFRRFGLTVRVGGTVRDLLLRVRMRTGRTTQSILHDALVSYLATIERTPTDR